MNTNKPKDPAQTTDYLMFSSVGLLDAYTDFILSRQSMLLSKRTIEYYTYMLGDFIKWSMTQNIHEPADISVRSVRQFLFAQSGRHLSDYTIHGYARAVRAFMHFLVAENYVPTLIRFDMPKVKKRCLPSLDAENVVELLQKCNRREYAIIMFRVDTRRAPIQNGQHPQA